MARTNDPAEGAASVPGSTGWEATTSPAGSFTDRDRLYAALEAGRVVAFDWDALTDTVERSPNADTILGCPARRGSGRAFFEQVHEDDRKALRGVMLSLKPGQPEYQTTFRYVRPADGRVLVLEETARGEFDALGKLVRVHGLTRDVTDQKWAEEVARKREAELREAQRVAHIGSWQRDLKTGITVGSEEIMRIFGLDPGAKRLPAFQDQRGVCYPVEEWERLQAAINRAIDSGMGYELDLRAFRHGTTIWVTARGEVIRDATGRITGLRGTVQDITDRKLAEEALHESELRYRRLHETLRDAFVIVDLSGRIQDCNGVYEQMLGYTREELQGLTFRDFTPAKWHAMEDRVIAEEILPRGSSQVYEKEYRHKNGTTFPVELRTFLIRDNTGQPHQMWAIVRDITERKRIEAALRESEERFEIMADGTPVGIWVHDENGKLRFANRAFCQFFGLSLEQVTARTWKPAVHPEDVSSYAKEFRDCHARRGMFHAQARIQRHDGQWRWIESFGTPRFSQFGGFLGMAGSSVDITQRKEMEAALEQNRDQLEQLIAKRTAKLQRAVMELEHFSYSITHDMRAPLRAMRSFGDLLMLNWGDQFDPEAKAFVKKIQDAAGRMDHLIRDALNYSKALRDDMPLEPQDPGVLLRSMAETYPEFQETRADIEIAPDMPYVMGNSSALVQCFSNLLDNAVKFVPPQTKANVRISAELRAFPGKAPGGEPEERVRIWFEDNGIGIAPEHQQQIWVMFQKLHRGGEGTGVGLALVRKVVERMGGKAGVESELGRGSRFWVELKKAARPTPGENATPLETPVGC